MKSTQRLLLNTAIAATAVAAVSSAITKAVVDISLDRHEPKIVQKFLTHTISGSGGAESDFIRVSRENAQKLAKKDLLRVEIVSHDGIRLVGHWYPAASAKRILIAMHGWRSGWANDFGGIADFWHENGCSVLFAEQRGQGESGGDTMGFGAIEQYDCRDWILWAARAVTPHLPIYPVGISMGATTVLLTSGLELPDQVHGIMADCGFTSPNAIWKHVLEDNLHLRYDFRQKRIDALCQKKLHKPFNRCSTIDALKKNTRPVLFIHGTADTFVPVEMTYQNYLACRALKVLFIAPGADHGMSFLAEPERYKAAVLRFWEEYDGN